MNGLLEHINSAGQWFAESAGAMLVQSSVLIVILLLADFLLRKKVRAVFRYWLWMLVLVKLVLPVTLSTPFSLGNFVGEGLFTEVNVQEPVAEHGFELQEPLLVEGISPVPEVMGEAEVVEPAEQKVQAAAVAAVSPLRWEGVVFLVWAVVVLVMMLMLLQRAFFVFGLVAQAGEASERMRDELEEYRLKMGMRGKIGLKISANATSPAVCGLFRPVILVPQELGARLTKAEMRAVLMHELSHIKRGDLWVNLVQTVLQIVYFYNPLLWVANAVIRRVREQAVDEAVLVAMGEGARQYPRTLVNVAKMVFGRPALSLRLIGVVESKSALKGRVKRMLERPLPKSAKLGIAGLVIVLLFGSVLLPMAKVEAGAPELVIKGVVTDAGTGEPIAGARVFDDGYGPGPDWSKIQPDKRSEWGAITNSAGQYSFLTWPEHHGIKVEAPGYKAKRESLYSGHFTLNKKDEEIFDFGLTPEKAAEQSEFKATLSNGVTVELISVCKAIDNQRCWAPDGSLFSKAPYYKSGAWAGSEKFEFAFRVENLYEEQSATSWKIDGKYATTSGNREHPTDEAGKEIADIWVIDAKIIEGVQKCNISFGVAAGSWQTQAKCVGIQGMVTSKDQHPYTFSQAYVHNNMVCVTVSDNMVKLAKRLIAIDNNGNTHLSESVRTGSTQGLRQSTFGFKNLKLEDVKEFQFQTQPYEWTEFKNVSLKLNFKTNVQINIEPEESGTTDKTGSIEQQMQEHLENLKSISAETLEGQLNWVKQTLMMEFELTRSQLLSESAKKQFDEECKKVMKQFNEEIKLLKAKLESNLIAYWDFDDNTKDKVGNNDGIVEGAALTDGIKGQAYLFDGKNDFIQTSLSIDQSGDKSITMSVWVYPTTIGGGMHQVISTDDGGHDWSIYSQGGKWHVFTGDYTLNSGFDVDVNKWQHLVAVFSVEEDRVYFYKNGASSSITGPVSTDISTNNICFGANPGPWSEHFKGKIDEASIYEKALSAEEIHNIFQAVQILVSPSQKPTEQVEGGGESGSAMRIRKSGRKSELFYDDGSSEGRESISGGGHAVIFDAPGEGFVVKAVRIYGSRYGDTKPPKEDFHIWVCDEEFNVIKEFLFPYSRFRKGEPKWVTLRLEAIEVPLTFVVCAGFNPEKTKGVYVHYDESGSGNCFIGLPGKEMAVFNEGEWMIRAILEQGRVGFGLPAKGGSKRRESPEGKWESVDYVREIEDFKPGVKSWGEDLFLKGIEFRKGGKTSNPMMSWSGDWIIHGNGKTKAKYVIERIDGVTYMFLPWLSGDVTIRGRKPGYYVLKKID